MRCTAKNADETPCTAEATTNVLSNGRIVYVCAFHNGMMSKVVRAGRVSPVRLKRRDWGAWKSDNELLGIEFPEKRNRR